MQATMQEIPNLKEQITRKEAIVQIAEIFSQAGLYFGHGTDNADDEAFQLVLARSGLDYPAFCEALDAALTQGQCDQLNQDIQNRIKTRKPLPYITNMAFLGGLAFYVDERVIIPRSPIAELIDEQFFPWLAADFEAINLLDMCTGSGCLAILMAKAFPGATVDAVDISPDALAVAHKNVENLGVRSQVTLYESDLFTALPQKRYDVIVCNPPYVDDEDFAGMPEEYTHEPKLALHAEDQGLILVDKMLKTAASYLTESGILIVEVGNSQAALEARYPEAPFVWLEFTRGGQGVFLLTARELGVLSPPI